MLREHGVENSPVVGKTLVPVIDAPVLALGDDYPNAIRPGVQIAVSDSGIGIPASLRAALPPRLRSRSDAQLIMEACQKGLSRHGPIRRRHAISKSIRFSKLALSSLFAGSRSFAM